MKIEDAIKRYESWAEDNRIDVLIRKEHRQMADWLKELKELKADRPLRCKDCHKYKYDWCHKFANVVKPDDFCSYAERRKDENSSR